MSHVSRKAAVVLAVLITVALPATALARESLSISVPRTVKLHHPFHVVVRGVGTPQDALNVYLDHHRCAAHGFDEDSRRGTKQIIMDYGFHGRFARTATVDPVRRGKVFVCAYLTPPPGARELARTATYTAR